MKLEKPPSERPPWWKTTQWETALMEDYSMSDHLNERLPSERPPWWNTTKWETTLMKEFRLLSETIQWDHPDERLPVRPPWWNTTDWETTLMKDYWVRDYPVRPPWWKTTSETTDEILPRDHPDERLPSEWDRPDEKLSIERSPWWKTINETILMKDYPMSDHPDERLPHEWPPWWETTPPFKNVFSLPPFPHHNFHAKRTLPDFYSWFTKPVLEGAPSMSCIILLTTHSYKTSVNVVFLVDRK